MPNPDASELHGAAEHVGVALEARAPHLVPEHGYGWRTCPLVGFDEVLKHDGRTEQGVGARYWKARANDDTVFIQFGDTGAGIPQDDLPRLFQPFHTTKKGGTGLGLMIVQRILRDHGGQVGIDSREGVGTVVTLGFPRKDRPVRLLER